MACQLEFIVKIILKYLTEGISLLCVLAEQEAEKRGQWVWKSALSQNNTLVLTILGTVSQ